MIQSRPLLFSKFHFYLVPSEMWVTHSGPNYVYMTWFCFSLRQQLSTSNSSDTESSRHKLNSGLLPKLAISAEVEHDEVTPCPREPHEEPEKPALPPAECTQEEPEVTTPASTISSSTLSGKSLT